MFGPYLGEIFMKICLIKHISIKILVIDLFLDSDSFMITYHISLVSVQDNYRNNNLLILDVKRLNKIMKLYCLEALRDGQGKLKSSTDVQG